MQIRGNESMKNNIVPCHHISCTSWNALNGTSSDPRVDFSFVPLNQTSQSPASVIGETGGVGAAVTLSEGCQVFVCLFVSRAEENNEPPPPLKTPGCFI